jgi:hypothetical protein
MSDFGMSSFLNNQQASTNNYNFGVLSHNEELDDHLQDQLLKLKGNQKSDIIGDVLTHTADAGKEAYLGSELSDAVKRYGQYHQDYNVDEKGHITANKEYLQDNMNTLKDKYSATPENEPLRNETQGRTGDTGGDVEMEEVSSREGQSIPQVRPDPRGARLTISEDPSDLQENMEEGHNGDSGEHASVEDSTGVREGNGAGAGGDVERSTLSKVTGVTDEGLDVAKYGAKKIGMTAIGLTNTIEDIKNGHLQGDNWEEKVGDVGSQIGAGLDLIGTAVPILEPLGAGISVLSGIATGIGHIVDDIKDKKPVSSASLQAKTNAQKLRAETSNSYQQMGLVSSISKNPRMVLGGTSAF